jgi:hypothetical protein
VDTLIKKKNESSSVRYSECRWKFSDELSGDVCNMANGVEIPGETDKILLGAVSPTNKLFHTH